MDLLAERGRRVSVDELNTSRLLAHARKQAVKRKLDDVLIVDVDAHHYENEHYSDILPYMENDVFRQWTMGGRGMTDRGSVVPTNAGFIQDMGGRVTRYPLRRSEKTEQGGKHRDVQLGERWMDAMSVDYSCLFPTGMLNIGMHPQKEMGRISAGPTTAGSLRRCCPRPAAACIPCYACRSPIRPPACARSRPSAAAST